MGDPSAQAKNHAPEDTFNKMKDRMQCEEVWLSFVNLYERRLSAIKNDSSARTRGASAKPKAP